MNSRQATRVAVFSQPGFPVYGVPIPDTIQLAADLRAAGFIVDALDVDALAEPSVFSARKYAALVLPYGNTFPGDAFENLRRFHAAGGSLITTGIPFTHTAANLSVRGWEATPDWGESVRRVRDGVGFALRVTGDPDRWTGASSAKFRVKPGKRVEVTARLKIRRKPVLSTPSDTRDDRLLVRFYDGSDRYLSQDGADLASASGERIVTRVVAPAGAARADLSIQVRRPGASYDLTDFRLMVDREAGPVKNARFLESSFTFSDLGHSDKTARFGPDGIGIGGFSGPESGRAEPFRISPGDPLGLRGVVTETDRPSPAPQWLDVRSLPSGVRVVPAVGTANRPLVALLIHESGPFAGAVDAWTYRVNPGDRESYETRQTLCRATVAALKFRKVLTESQADASLARLSKLPRPKIYANLVLPERTRAYSTFQPKPPAPARELFVADIRALSADEKLLLISLQGIVNRKQPRIYLISDPDDTFWLGELRRQGVTDAPKLVANPFELLSVFASEIRGAIVCDPKVYVSPCVAASLAGIERAVIVRDTALLSRGKLNVAIDLRGKFKGNADALRYLRTEIAPRLDPFLTCTLDPAVFDKGGLDHVIASHGSVFWITGPLARTLPGANAAGELDEVRAHLAALPLGAVVRGFWWRGDGIGLQEDAGVAMASRFGKVTLVSDLVMNLSVHSGAKIETLSQKPRPAPPTLDRAKVYVCFTMSDGDNLCTWRGYFRKYFNDPARGTVPVGWGMSPALIDLAPTWARWYYENATPLDEFLCDVSGVAYIYPPSWGASLSDRAGALRHFYGETKTAMARMDMTTIRLMDVNVDAIAEVARLLPETAYLLPDYGHAGITRYPELTYSLPSGQSVFRAATSGSGPENFARQIRERAGRNRPAFLNAFVWNWGSTLSELKKTLELLGPEYVAVTPSQLDALYRRSRANESAAR